MISECFSDNILLSLHLMARRCWKFGNDTLDPSKHPLPMISPSSTDYPMSSHSSSRFYSSLISCKPLCLEVGLENGMAKGRSPYDNFSDFVRRST